MVAPCRDGEACVVNDSESHAVESSELLVGPPFTVGGRRGARLSATDTKYPNGETSEW